MISARPAETVRRAGIYLLPAAAGYAMPLVTLAVVTRVLSHHEYGLYALAQVYAVFAAGLVNCGMPSAFERTYFQLPDRAARARLLYSTLAFVAATTTAGAVVTWWYADVLSVWILGEGGHAGLVVLTYVSIAVFNLRSYYLIWLRNEGRAGEYARFSLDETVAGGIAQMVCVALLGLGVAGLAVGQLVAGGAVLLLVAVSFGRDVRPAIAWRPLRTSLRLALPLTPRIFIGTLEGQAGKYVSGQLASIGAAGVYGIAQRIAYGVFTGMTAIQGAYGPVVYQRLTDAAAGAARGVGPFLMPFAYASAALALMVILAAEEAIWLLVPPSYAGAADVIALLSAYYAVLFFGKITGPQLLVAGWPVLVSLISVITVGLSLAAMIVFTPLWGPTGTAFGTLVAGIGTGLFAVWIAQRVRPVDWPWLQCTLIFGLVIAAAAAVTLLRAAEVDYIVRLAIKLSMAAAYVALGVRLGFLSRETWPLLVEAARGRRPTGQAARQEAEHA